MEHTLFDNEAGINRLFNDGDLLDDHPDMVTRWFAMELMDKYFPEPIEHTPLFNTSPEYEAITQGRASAAYKTKDFFSTCGEVTMWLMERLGYVGNVLNRDLDVSLPEEVGGGHVKKRYRFGKNMQYTFSRSKKEGVWVPFDGRSFPLPGDIVFIANFPDSRTEHVFVFKESIQKNGKTIWRSYDGGQYIRTHYEQCVKIRERELRGRSVIDSRSRQVHGWIDITKLDLDRPATLEMLAA